jgi:acyl-coenzyme A synthetase/AMP-(fatty) acid ligase
VSLIRPVLVLVSSLLQVTVAPGMPSFHSMGVLFQLMQPLYAGRTTAVFRPTYPRPPTITTPETVLEALKALRPNVAFVVPSLLEAWSHDRDAVEFLKTLDNIVRSIPRFSFTHL